MDVNNIDPGTWYRSIAGIVAATLIAVQVLKKALGRVPVAKEVPTWIYAVLVASLATYASSYFGVLDAGEDTLLASISKAVVGAAVASGFWSWFSEPGDKLKESTLAQGRGTVVALLVAVGLTTMACGPTAQQNARQRAVQVDTAVAEALFAVQDAENAIYQSGLITQPEHQRFNQVLLPVLETGLRFNRTIRAWNPDDPMPKEVREMIPQIRKLLDHAITTLVKDDVARGRLVEKIAIAQAAVLAALSFLPQGGV